MELEEQDEVRYANFLRMDSSLFTILLDQVKPLIERQDMNRMKCIGGGERITITLRFLATGESFRSLQYLFRVSEQSIGSMFIETCKALVSVLKQQYLKVSNIKFLLKVGDGVGFVNS